MQRKILIIDDHNDLAEALQEVFTHLGHLVRIVENRDDALALEKTGRFDLTITDLDIEAAAPPLGLNGNRESCLPEIDAVRSGDNIKAFKLCAANFHRGGFDEEELKGLI